ncbi:MAG: hypothetical protein ACHQNE_05195 [Candidatus Kapaibacterium sp.]
MLSQRSIFPAVGIAILLAFAAMSSNSCSSGTSNPNPVDDTIHLVSNAQQITFHSDSTVDSIRIWLSCGCKYRLITMGSGGNVSLFTEQSLTSDTAFVTPHYLRFQYHGPAKGTTWYAFSAVDHYGNPKYDTLRVSADQ